ncbi:type III secretion system export apparatus subunit SctT [Erwinia sp. BNK-24-b]|uniref:type III secretion system export apparatus subunit SctT n=1 Tax=Erwinia TaxID=551 RepID=UPI001FED7217|nr:type III secretion system export apparatus subunit SctT [Erwinia phyllosphaerae]MBV4368600.1 type III secretion system export apparatus subunit SctT [Erwinia phyllosphaerae]
MWNSVLFDGYHFILALTLAMARIFPCLLLSPVFSFNAIKGGLRSGIVLALALFPAPMIQQQLAVDDPSLFLLAALALKEVIIGVVIGLLLAMPFWLFESVGALFDNQRGALMGGQLNPQLGPDATPLGFLMQQSIILLLVVGLGLSTITQIIWDSYRLWPPMQWLPLPSEAGFHAYLQLLGGIFMHMVLYAGPLVALLLLVDFSVGILSIYSPQLQATVLAMPAKCLLGMLFFVLYLPILNYVAGERLFDLKDLLPQLADILGKGAR